jgi:acyl carrier protein
MPESELMKAKVDAAFREAFGIDETVDHTTFVYNASAGWDSVGHMALVAALEKQFDCILDMEDILDMSSYEKALQIMAKYG